MESEYSAATGESMSRSHQSRADYYAPSGFIGDEYEWYPGCFVL
jgi:hypothetical protein